MHIDKRHPKSPQYVRFTRPSNSTGTMKRRGMLRLMAPPETVGALQHRSPDPRRRKSQLHETTCSEEDQRQRRSRPDRHSPQLSAELCSLCGRCTPPARHTAAAATVPSPPGSHRGCSGNRCTPPARHAAVPMPPSGNQGSHRVYSLSQESINHIGTARDQRPFLLKKDGRNRPSVTHFANITKGNLQLRCGPEHGPGTAVGKAEQSRTRPIQKYSPDHHLSTAPPKLSVQGEAEPAEGQLSPPPPLTR